jgi:16S rRNA processing protein RimM
LQLVVGRIGRAHGVQGEATVEVRTDQPDQRFAVGATVSTEDGRNLIITGNRWHNKILLLSFAGITDRDQVEQLRDQLVSTEVNTEDQEPGEYHFQQLIGCQVKLEDSKDIGVVREIIQLPGQDLLGIDTPNGEVLIPMVKQMIIAIDIKAKLIVVNPPEGLLDVEN